MIFILILIIKAIFACVTCEKKKLWPRKMPRHPVYPKRSNKKFKTTVNLKYWEVTYTLKKA